MGMKVKEEGWGRFGHLGHRAGACRVKVHTVGLQVQLEVGAAPQGAPRPASVWGTGGSATQRSYLCPHSSSSIP